MSTFLQQMAAKAEKAEGGEVDAAGFQVHPGDCYDTLITSAFLLPAKSGAIMLHLSFQNSSGFEYNTQEYFATKDGDPTYIGKRGKNEGKKVKTLGYVLLDTMLKLVSNKGVMEAETAPKNVKVTEDRKQVTKEVDMFVDLINQPIKLGLVCNIVNRQQKVGSEYKNTNEKTERNEINKVFDAQTGQTLTEREAGEPATFLTEKWLPKNKDVKHDRFSPVTEPPKPASASDAFGGGSSFGATTGQVPDGTSSLFPNQQAATNFGQGSQG